MTDCSRCGDCCERIWSVPPAVVEAMLARPPSLAMTRVEQSNYATALFVTEHWTATQVSVSSARWSCDAFDPDTRLCTAHEARPPVCSGFPWYGQEPTLTKELHPRCSFNADVRTTLPIAAVNGRSTTCGSSAQAEGT